ncbi:MAG: SDR family oxidoreductase [Actinomycetota bacterium]
MSPEPFDLSGRTAIVTGGTKGLGRTIAETLLDHGADVVVCARNQPPEPIEQRGRQARFVAADVRNPDEIAAVVEAALAATGRIDILVNNAGGAPPSDSASVSPRFNEKIVALNLLGPLMFSQAVHDTMQAQEHGGVIVNISSVSGTRANPKGAAYGAAKAGLINLTQTLAHEWGPKIRVVAPVVGMIVTEDAHLFYGDEAGIAAVGATLPMQRMGETTDIARAVLFLVSPMASWMTGCAVPVDGGGDPVGYLDAANGEASR